jgi:hypothetical protein
LYRENWQCAADTEPGVLFAMSSLKLRIHRASRPHWPWAYRRNDEPIMRISA